MGIWIFEQYYSNIKGIKAYDEDLDEYKTFISPEGTINISGNGSVDVTDYAFANVNIPTSTVSLQEKAVSPSTSQQIVTADTGYNGLSKVTVSAMPSMTLPSAATASATSGFTSKATISRSTADQYINIPTGYNNTNSYYKINAVANGSATAPNTISGDQATVTTGTNTLTLSKTVSVTPNVSAGYISNGTSGNSAVSLTANITTKSAATITPSTTNQTIAAGTYLTGAQTISGDANLVAGNIKSGVSIFGTTGSYSGAEVNLQANKEVVSTEEEQTILPGPILTTIVSLSDIWKTNSDSNSNFVSLSVDLSSLVAGQTYYVLGNGSSTVYGSDMGDAWYVDSDFVYQPGASLPFSFLSDMGFDFDSIIINNSSIQANFSYNDRWGFGITELIFYKKENSNYDGFSSITVKPIPYNYINEQDIDWRFITVHPLKTSQYVDSYSRVELGYFSGLSTGGRGNISFSVDLSFLEENTRYFLKGRGIAGYSGGSSEAWIINGIQFFTYTSGVQFSYISSSILKNISITNSSMTFNFKNYNDDGYYVSIEELAFYSYSRPTSEKSRTFLDAVFIEPIPDNYIDTGDANAYAGGILEGYTAYAGGQKITGTMPFNSYVEETITTQNGTYTLSEGYYPGGIITATLPTSTLTNSIISGASYEENTGDYAWRTTVAIPAGYHAAQTIEKSFSSIFPAPDTPATASQILIGYQTYDKDGKLVTGTMANNTYSNTLTTGRLSVTIPAGYHDGTGTVSVASGSATTPATSVTAGDINTSSVASNTGLVTITTKAATKNVTPTVSAGYISSGTAGTITVPTKTYTYQLPTVKTAATITPSTSNQTIAAGTYLTGTQTIAGDADLIATNIKSGVQIFGVTGTYTGEGANLQSKTGITPSTSSQTITADSGYDGLSSVQINAMPSGSVSVPNTTITANPTLSTTYTSGSGYQITVSKTQTVNPSVTAGYVSAGTGGTMTVSGSAYVAQSAITNNTTLPSGSTSSGTIDFGSYIKIGAGYYPTDRYYRSYSTTGSVTAPSSISGSTATLSTGSGTLTLTKTVSVTPNVTTAGYITTGTAGNSSVSLTANVTTKAAATITPGTTNQTISAGTYLTGTQTISGDTDLVAANIKSGVTIFNTTGSFTSDATAGASEIISGATAYVDGEKITGTLVVNRCYISSSAPSSSLGNNGDIYIQE